MTVHPSDRRRDRGVTLVELLIVIAIMGVLVAATTLTVRGFTNQGDAKSCELETQAVNTAIHAYYSEHRVWITTGTMNLLVPDLLDEVPSASTPSGGGTIGADHVFTAVNC